MQIKRLSLTNFRSYESFSLDDISGLTIFVGPNAAGKTNIIESIQLLTALTTFRKASSKELIRNSCDFGRIVAEFSNDDRELEIAMTLGEGRRKYTLNGKPKSIKDLKGILPAISFTPDDLNLAKGSSKYRRDEIDLLGSQVNTNFYQIIRDFEKILRHKNKILKENPRKDILESINDVFIKVSSQLTSYRSSLLEKLFPLIAKQYAQIAQQEAITVKYIPSWCNEEESPEQDSIALPLPFVKEQLALSLDEHMNDEIHRGQSFIGANRDKIVFEIDGLDASLFASQGQQRSLVLSLKLAEAELLESMTGQLPVLLLDDVMSELDKKRRDALIGSLLQDKQTFITTAHIDYFDIRLLESARIVDIPPHPINIRNQ